MTNKIYTFSEAINLSLTEMMKKNSKILLLGQGIDDPKKIFGTTRGLDKKFGENRVFDMPTAENSMIGISIGLCLKNYKCVVTFQRAEFALLATEQIINQASKWHFMSSGKTHIPLVMRMLVGRGWGQGPQHSQSLEMVYTNIPGIKVVSPSSPNDAYHLMKSSIEDNNPIIFMENRWLYDIKGKINKSKNLKIGKCKVLNRGNDITLVTFSYMVIECQRCVYELKKLGISIELIDLRTIKPLDFKTIIKSVSKTKKLIVVDNGWKDFGVSSEILAKVIENIPDRKIRAKSIGIFQSSIASSYGIAKHQYPTPYKISIEILRLLNKKTDILNKVFINKLAHDQPNENFKGPF